MRRLASFLIALMTVAAFGCATTPGPPPPPQFTVNVSGNWLGTWWAFDGEGGSGDIRGRFLQDGTTVNGEFVVTGRVNVNTTFVSGVVSGNQVILSTPSPGNLVVNGAEMSGVVSGLTPVKITLRKQP